MMVIQSLAAIAHAVEIFIVVINNLYRVPCNFKSNIHTQDPKIVTTSIDIFIVFDISRLFFG